MALSIYPNYFFTKNKGIWVGRVEINNVEMDFSHYENVALI